MERSDDQNIIIYRTADGKAEVALYALEGNVWMTQTQLAELFATSVPNISTHISNILGDNELVENSVLKEYLTTAADGKDYKVNYYSLEMILAIGFRVRSKRGTQFRIWANQNLRTYMVKGFLMDDERLKNPDGRPDYFDELLERIRDIRASEKRFYQKVKDLFTLCSDYDPTDKATQMFFAETQNKLLFAATGHTAAEIIVSRANAEKPNMALTSWKGSIVRKQDIFTAKNYLFEEEIDILNRLTVIFLETAELRAKDRRDLTLGYWKTNVDSVIEFSGKEVLSNSGSISKANMETQVKEIYENFHQKRKEFEAQSADLEELEFLGKKLKRRSPQ